jgi:hypothetical protein
MGRKRRDAIDLACEEWAQARRKMLGLDDTRLAKEVIGPMRSTLGARRDLHAGSKSEGRVEQHWPEVYGSETALEVARAYRQMGDMLRCVLDAHYVARGPVDVKADALAMSRARYFSTLNMAKAFVEGWLAR